MLPCCRPTRTWGWRTAACAARSTRSPPRRRVPPRTGSGARLGRTKNPPAAASPGRRRRLRGYAFAGCFRGSGNSLLAGGVDDALEQPASVLAAEDSLRQALRVRHHPEDVPARVGDPGDVRQRPVRVAARDAADTRLIDVPERDLLLALEPAQSFVVDEVVPVAVSDGNADDVALRVPSRPRGHRVLHFEVDVPAHVLQRVVASHGAWQQTALQQDL